MPLNFNILPVSTPFSMASTLAEGDVLGHADRLEEGNRFFRNGKFTE
jgi:hypothetical protein